MNNMSMDEEKKEKDGQDKSKAAHLSSSRDDLPNSSRVWVKDFSLQRNWKENSDVKAAQLLTWKCGKQRPTLPGRVPVSGSDT